MGRTYFKPSDLPEGINKLLIPMLQSALLWAILLGNYYGGQGKKWRSSGQERKWQMWRTQKQAQWNWSDLVTRDRLLLDALNQAWLLSWPGQQEKLFSNLKYVKYRIHLGDMQMNLSSKPGKGTSWGKMWKRLFLSRSCGLITRTVAAMFNLCNHLLVRIPEQLIQLKKENPISQIFCLCL